MQVHGLTGGIGSGKSTVTRMLGDLGVPVLDADAWARDAVAPGSPGLAAVVEAFGEGVLTADGALDRPKLGAIVFADPERRRALEGIIHPRVRQGMADALMAFASAGEPIAFMDIPLLYESRDPAEFVTVAVVHVPPEVQLERVIQRDGLSPQAAQARIDAQLPIDDKARRADWIIDNSGDRAFTRAQVEWLVARLRADAARG